MVNQADAPLQKITINIYEKDYRFLKRKFGQGYSIAIRDMIKTGCDVARRIEDRANDF